MKEELRTYMNQLVADVPKSRKVLELKEELISNMEERYDDLISAGYREEDAYQSVVDSMGDVGELFAPFREEIPEGLVWVEQEEIRRKRAWISTVAVGMYIFSIAFFITFSSLEDIWTPARGSGIEWSMVGFIGLLILCMIPTCMLVYSSYMYPKYKKGNDTVVEEFKQWQNEGKQGKQRRRAIALIIWLGAMVVYVLVSFKSGAWHITWITFLIAGCLHAASLLFADVKKS